MNFIIFYHTDPLSPPLANTLVGTAIFTLLVFYYTRHMQGGYDVKRHFIPE